MAWSLLTPKVKAVLTAAEAQRNEPGINQIDGCGPTCVSCLMQIHGYADIEPQDLVGQYYKGGTTGPQLNAIIAKRYPNPPAMAYVTSADPIGDLARWAAQGFLAMGLFWSSAAAIVKPYNTGIGHWCIPVEDDGIMITFWNPEWGSFDRISHADFLKASWHQFNVCQRAIPKEDAMDPAELTVFHHDLQETLLGDIDESASSVNSFIAAAQAGKIVDVMIGWMKMPQSVAYRDAIKSLVATTGKVDHLAAPGADAAAVAAAAAARKQLHDDLQKVVEDLATTTP